jgi:hypothetical protein
MSDWSEFKNRPTYMYDLIHTIQANTDPTCVFAKLKFLRSQTTSRGGLKVFESVFERKKKRKRKQNKVQILFKNFQIYFKKAFIIRA